MDNAVAPIVTEKATNAGGSLECQLPAIMNDDPNDAFGSLAASGHRFASIGDDPAFRRIVVAGGLHHVNQRAELIDEITAAQTS